MAKNNKWLDKYPDGGKIDYSRWETDEAKKAKPVNIDGEVGYEMKYALPEVTIKGKKKTPDFAKDLPYWDQISEEDRKYLIEHKDDTDPVTRAIRAKARSGYGIGDNPTYMESVKTAGRDAVGLPVVGALQTFQIPQAAMIEGIEALRGNDYDFSNVIPNYGEYKSDQRQPSDTFLKDANPVLQFAGDVLLDPLIFAGLKAPTRAPFSGINLLKGPPPRGPLQYGPLINSLAKESAQGTAQELIREDLETEKKNSGELDKYPDGGEITKTYIDKAEYDKAMQMYNDSTAASRGWAPGGHFNREGFDAIVRLDEKNNDASVDQEVVGPNTKFKPKHKPVLDPSVGSIPVYTTSPQGERTLTGYNKNGIFYSILEQKDTVPKYPDGGEVKSSEEPIYYGGILPAIEITPSTRDANRIPLLQEAKKAAQEGEEFERDRLSALKYLSSTTNANTCVSATCELEKRAGRTGMPEDLVSNKKFFENYADYGYQAVDPKNVKPGDVIQYYNDDEYYGYHMGVMGNDSMYYSSPGNPDLPWLDTEYSLKNAYYKEDGAPKDKFHAYKYVGFKQGGAIPNTNKTTYNNWLDKL
jgi:hypothetical protein